MDVRVGELNKRIQIIRREWVKGPEEPSSSAGTLTDTVVRTPWAKFSRTSGSELFTGNADVGSVKARFLIRHSSKVPITRKMIVRYDGADYEIEYVNDYNDGHEYDELICSRVTRAAR